MSRPKKNNTKHFTSIKEVFDYYDEQDVPGMRKAAWEEYLILTECCNNFIEGDPENEYQTEKILKAARSKASKYPGILSGDVKTQWQRLFHFLLDAEKLLDLTGVWPKFDLITSVATITETKNERLVNHVEKNHVQEPHENHIRSSKKGDVQTQPPQTKTYNQHENSVLSEETGFPESDTRQRFIEPQHRQCHQPHPVEVDARVGGDVMESPDEDDALGTVSEVQMFNQLYNGEWTDSFQLLKEAGMDEHVILKILCDFVQNTYEHCKRTAEQRQTMYDEIKRNLEIAMFYPFEERDDDSTKVSPEALSPDGVEKVDRVHSELCSKLRHETDRNTIRIISKTLKDKNDFLKRNKLKFFSETLRQYADKCVEIIWSLCSEEPEVTLVFPDEGTSVDSELFSFYGSTGDTVKLCVWPAVTSGENGVLLHKGIVLPYSPDDKMDF